jgi:peptidyl-prolyl cis-trans isomerase SurA
VVFKNLFRQFAALFAFIFVFSFVPAVAQESEPVVIDEVIAQVNDGVITLSRVKREMKNAAAAAAQQQGKPIDQVMQEVEAKRTEFIAGLINEELLLQQAKEMSLEQEIEQAVNQDFVGMMKQFNFKTLEELNTAIRSQGEDPDDIRAAKRKQYAKFLVYRYGVEGKIYNSLSDKELKAYYEANKDKFKKPETVSLSEIFLNYAGRNAANVKKEADEIVKKARAGEDFKKLVTQYSDRQQTKAEGGKLGTAEVKVLEEKEAKLFAAIKNVKTGGIAEPFEEEDGIMILRVDERTADTNAPAFDERKVREAITFERSAAERKKYMMTLRQDAYIKIADGYKTEVSKLLDKTETPN